MAALGSGVLIAVFSDLVAYIDPGAGSLFIQAVIAAAVVVPVFFRNQIARIVRTFRRPR